MLRSGSSSIPLRVIGYTLAAGSVALFLYLLVVVVLVTASVGNTTMWIWSLLWCGIPLVVGAVLIRYVHSKPYSGGYALVGLAGLVGAFMCLMALFPFLIF